jgi:two-component system response regulator NreC
VSKLRILIVDDHGIVRAGIRALLEAQPDIQVVGEAARGEEGVEKAVQLQPELVLMDITLPEMDGIEATRLIKEKVPDVQVLVLTMHDDEEFFFPVLKAGASGYILKGAEPQELLYAIRVVSQGQVFLSPAVAKSVLGDFTTARTGTEDDKYSKLTPREREVLRLAAGGQSNREMAETLFLSIRTVEKYRQTMMHKLGLSRREHVTKYALRKGIIDSEV